MGIRSHAENVNQTIVRFRLAITPLFLSHPATRDDKIVERPFNNFVGLLRRSGIYLFGLVSN